MENDKKWILKLRLNASEPVHTNSTYTILWQPDIQDNTTQQNDIQQNDSRYAILWHSDTQDNNN